mgnify:CR=1 FL=1
MAFLAVCAVWLASPLGSADEGGRRKISWQSPFSRNGEIVIIGSIETTHGGFEFRWVLGSHGEARLVTLVAFGAGELPPREMKLFPLVRKGGTTLLFQEWFPLVGVEEPPTIRVVAEVPTAELFSVLPAGQQPPPAAISKRRQTIEWTAVQERDGRKYLPGRVKASFGTLEIIWKKEPDHMPELIMLETPGAGELTPTETRLYLWTEAAAGATVICREVHPRLDQEFVSHLQCLVTVRTTELISGFRSINR